MNKKLVKLLISFVILLSLVTCLNLFKENEEKNLTTIRYEEQINDEEISEADNEEVDKGLSEEIVEDENIIEILSLGNIIVHDKQIEGAKINDSYDFSPSFKYIENMIANADISLAILETSFSGGTPKGYPLFNTPDVFLDNIKDIGIDIVNYANNHILDGQADGFRRTIDITREKDIDILGIKSNEEESNYLIKEVNGQKIGFISYTFETEKVNGSRTINAIKIPNSISGLVNTFNYNELDSFYANIENEINLMKQQGVKFIITSVHWGEEYETTQNEVQINIAKKLNELGVDIILGGHPHVIQPYETIKNESGHETLVIYSQGNTLSNQCEEEIGIAESEDGILVDLKLKVKDDEIYLEEYKIIPTWVYRNEVSEGNFEHTIIPVEDAIKNRLNYQLSEEGYLDLDKSLIRTNNIVKNR